MNKLLNIFPYIIVFSDVVAPNTPNNLSGITNNILLWILLVIILLITCIIFIKLFNKKDGKN